MPHQSFRRARSFGDQHRLTGMLTTSRVATVYRAEEVETGRAVMVKLFHELGRNDRGLTLGSWGSWPTASRAPWPELPGAFVAVHTCDLTDEGQLFLVTDLVEGPSVADLLRRTPPIAPVRALDLAIRIGEALEAARNLGVLDLQVTPRDVIVVDDADRVKLLRSDTLMLRHLGLADRLSAAEAAERDPRYASPEELAGIPPTERSVIYRFGVLLYELLSGSPPFEGTTPAEVRDRQLRSSPSRLRRRHRRLPASLDRLVSRMISLDPMARPVDSDVDTERTLGCHRQTPEREPRAGRRLLELVRGHSLHVAHTVFTDAAVGARWRADSTRRRHAPGPTLPVPEPNRATCRSAFGPTGP